MEKKKLKSIMTPCGRMYMNPDVYGYENENKWTKKRKALCAEIWDDCAQESCAVPCSVVLEKDKATVSRKRRKDGDNEQA